MRQAWLYAVAAAALVVVLAGCEKGSGQGGGKAGRDGGRHGDGGAGHGCDAG
ncbi:hypothetical protein H7B90_27220 [Cohnella xylanilytica]|uniref:Uncharacterized protein n=1 Tax=Cohnella xylanilytica TaxID=557555 RepID=A0A841UAU8_9BACL|nr:hypothetical protein [Cohnella xylanilytica]MBB6695091.1 hypothetical protein [Cohnella xylanilytica]